MSATVFSTLSGVLTGKHPELGILCRETGEVLIPASGTNKAHWTYGSKNKRSGYMEVGFRGKRYYVHHIIAQTFLDNQANLPTIDHISRDKLDNRPSNLRFASFKTQSDNRQVCEDSLDKYGVRSVENKRAYMRAYMRARRAEDQDFADRERVRNREYAAKQRVLGKKQRKCP